MWWEQLEGFGMRLVWLEVNLMAVTLGEGKTDPRCVEYVWVNARDDMINSEHRMTSMCRGVQGYWDWNEY